MGTPGHAGGDLGRKKGSIRAVRGREDVRSGGARGSPRGGRRGLRVVLKGTAPDLSHCAGAEARTKQGGGGGARREVVRAYKALFAEVGPPNYPLPKQAKRRKQVPHPS